MEVQKMVSPRVCKSCNQFSFKVWYCNFGGPTETDIAKDIEMN